MYADTVKIMGDQAAAKLDGQRRSIVSHFVRSMLAGMYVGAAIALIFTVGGTVGNGAVTGPVRLLMGVCFGGALTIVIFAGSELFTGSNLVLTLAVLTGRAKVSDLASNWVWTWLGNLAGSFLLAFMVLRSGVVDETGMGKPVYEIIQKIVDAKMNIPPEQLFWRAVLANWLVCLGVWMAARCKDETAKILMIWWCMFTFITCGYEHSIANMFGLLLGLLVPNHAETITWGGYWYNLSLATLGNIVGGAIFVGGLYWLGSPKLRETLTPAPAAEATSEPAMANAKPELVGSR
jgi:nitrite transporter NirC